MDKSCLLHDWLSYSLSIRDRPLVVKGINFQIQNNGRKLTFQSDSLKYYFVRLVSLYYMSDSQLGCASLTICSWTTPARCLIVN